MSKFRKAIAAGIAAGLAVVAQGLTTGGLSSVNLAVVAGAAFAAALAVYNTPNAPAA